MYLGVEKISASKALQDIFPIDVQLPFSNMITIIYTIS